MIGHFVSATCKGENCHVCIDAGMGRNPATHKVGEEIAYDEPSEATIGLDRHNFTAYVCCYHFRLVMGRAVFCSPPPPTKETT